MNKSMTSAISILLAAIFIGGCGDNPPPGATESSEHAHEEGDADGEHEEHASEEPAGEHDEHEEEEHTEALQLTPEARKNAGIVVAAAAPGSISEVIPLYGVLMPNAEAVRSVAARFPGMVRSVSVVVGQSVRAGEPLATVESNESLQVYPVTSPLDGVVTERFTNVGEQAGSSPLFTVANLSTLWAELSLFPRDRARIRVGQTVKIRVTDSEDAISGKVVFISPLGSSASQSLTARVVIDNRDGALTPGLYVRGDVAVSQTQVPLALPASAVLELEGGTSVFVEDADGFESRLVRTGRTDGTTVEILEGLDGGDQVVVEGSFVLKAELGKGEAEHEH